MPDRAAEHPRMRAFARVITAVWLAASGGCNENDESSETPQKQATPAEPDGPVECGRLSSKGDPDRVLVALDDHGGKSPAIEALDPLSKDCKALEKRYRASEQAARLHRKALLVPLDDTCNWMVDKSVNPGACAISRAVLCAEDKGPSPRDVIQWAFDHRDELTAAAKRDPDAAEQRVRAQFPELEACIDAPKTHARLNKALRWALDHDIPATAPHLYVDGTKLCDPTRTDLDPALATLLR